MFDTKVNTKKYYVFATKTLITSNYRVEYLCQHTPIRAVHRGKEFNSVNI